ncbi:MAG: clostripain-related cysteine peptidase, partial [Clostridia bacterium]|nr:clostripain-related cysteine peptidase [Clostridia bacterium]
MNQNQRPHSRQKTTGSGTAGVGKGSQVNTGSRPVGSGGRTPNAPAPAPQRGAGPQRASTGLACTVGGKKLSLKSLLILGLAVIVLFVAIRSCGGGRISDYSDYTGYDTYPESVYTPSTSSTYTPSTSTTLYGNYPSIGQTTAITTPASYDAANYSVSNDARGKYYKPSGDGDETVTIMLYMCGTDLESKYGMASKDLQEMLNATVSDRVNLIVETGGCKQWKNKVISNQKNEIYKIEDDGLRRLESNFGTAAMTDPNNLTKFIKYCESNYEADRYMLIFWDHGGGSLSGYGYDEKNPEKSSMTLSKINSALAAAKDEDGDQIYFDVIGFDACLMATLETAFVTERYADYLLASEETEPGTGWYYTDWLTELSRDPEIPT